MKIDDVTKNIQQIPSLDTSVNKNIKNENSVPAEPEKTAQSGAKVELSSKSVEYSKAAEAMERIPEERAKKIEEIKARFDNGSYEIDSRKIADSILKDTLNNISQG